ncbi:SRPBCC family protein [Paenibacillus tepidiphilus]|uniref:SRPBCC family protein n=1 Tax=Paenibacillus tepidiphilus TaxID=2608683 RepID=UPI00123999C2|nr:SRPBCC family protein [Paenibacillus tepidiphilus]
MTNTPGKKRTDKATRIIQATPQQIYKALVDPAALAVWLPPKGMKGEMLEFDARVGGFYRMALTYLEMDASTQGKTTEDTDVVEGKFLEFSPDQRVVQLIEFESDDPAYAGEMTMTWSLAAVAEGTAVTILCENVPEGIRKEDHDEGLRSSLENLSDYIGSV